jgi:hypothetical protein
MTAHVKTEKMGLPDAYVGRDDAGDGVVGISGSTDRHRVSLPVADVGHRTGDVVGDASRRPAGHALRNVAAGTESDAALDPRSRYLLGPPLVRSSQAKTVFPRVSTSRNVSKADAKEEPTPPRLLLGGGPYGTILV